MSKVFVGNITSEAERLLSKYLDKFMPDAVVEPLKAAGIKGRVKNHARRPEVVLVILDEVLYDMCRGVADDVLSLPKVHRYVSDIGLQGFLTEKFGVLDNVPAVKSEEEESSSNKENVTEVIDEGYENLTVSEEDNNLDNIDKDRTIQKLNDELIIKDMMIRNLEAQVEEKSSDEDVSYFVSRIKSLETELENTREELSKVQNESYVDSGKLTRAEQLIDSVDNLKEELRAEKDKCSQLESSKSELEGIIHKKEQELERLNNYINEQDYGNLEAEDTITNLRSEYDLKVKEVEDLVAKNTELDEKIIEISSELAEIGVLNEKIDTLSEENERLREESSSLTEVRVELENLRVDFENVTAEKVSLSEKIAELKSKLSSSSTDMDTVTLDKERLERELKALTSDNEALSSQLNEISEKLGIKDNEIESLREQVSSMNGVSAELEACKSQISELQEEISELTIQLKQFEDTKASLSDKISEVETLQEQLNSKSLIEQELTNKTEELESIKLELEVKTNELNSITTERNNQSSLLTDKDSELENRRSELSDLSSRVEDLTNQIESLVNDKEALTTDNKKLRNEVEALRQKTSDSDILLQSSSVLEKEVTDYKCKIAKLQAENDSLKEDLEKSKGSSNKDIEIAKLRSEVSDYKEKLREVQDGCLEKTNEVLRLRDKCANMEITLLEKDKVIKVSEESIFNKMGTIALPKTVFNLSLDMPKDLPSMYVFASGSAESNLSMYQTLRRFCSSTNKSVFILDLVTDSYIDREFGVDKISSPIEFLQGDKPIKDFMSKTKVGNTYVSSTALNYLNSLYLLNVDWKKVLSNLVGLADIVIINVGCLNETVSKVLFNAFSSVMQSHIIIKASPINLRTALLTLSGIPSAKTSKVSCVGFEESSKVMYQRLAHKFNTQILKDSDVLKL